MSDVPPLIKSPSKSTGWRKVIFLRIIPSCILAFIIFSAFSTWRAAQSMADQLNCNNNLKHVWLAIKLYAGDNQDRFPTAQWCDIILTNGLEEHKVRVAKSFSCPIASKKLRSGYAMNRQLIGIKETDEIAQDTVLLFESDAGWNAVGGIEILAKRHYSGLNIALVDGTVREVHPQEIPNLRWNPFINSPAK